MRLSPPLGSVGEAARALIDSSAGHTLSSLSTHYMSELSSSTSSGDAATPDGFLSGAGESNIMVTVRVRPILESHDKSNRSIVHVLDRKVVILTDPGHAVSSNDGSGTNVNYLHSGTTSSTLLLSHWIAACRRILASHIASFLLA